MTDIGDCAKLLRDNGDGIYGMHTLQSALTAAVDGDEIVIGPGNWTQPVLTIAKNLVIRSESGAGTTILDGQLVGRLMHFTRGAECRVLGLTLTRGYLNDGGAVHVDYASQVKFSDCILRQNKASHVGGAAYVRHPGSDLSFTNCEFLDNFGVLNAGGVGISLESSCHFTGCFFRENKSYDMGGALANFAGALMEVRNCLFVSNKGGECGALRVRSGPAIIENNTFVNNTSNLGTLFINSDYSVVCRYNIFFGDTAGFGVLVVGNQNTFIICNLFHENSNGAIYGSPFGQTNIYAKPFFCNPEMDDFSLCDGSPAAPDVGTCNLIGAFDVGCEGCGPVSTETQTWGGLKALYR